MRNGGGGWVEGRRASHGDSDKPLSRARFFPRIKYPIGLRSGMRSEGVVGTGLCEFLMNLFSLRDSAPEK